MIPRHQKRARNHHGLDRHDPMDLAQLTSDLEALRARALDAAAIAPDTAALDAIELAVLGKKGDLTAILRGIGTLPAEDRPKVARPPMTYAARSRQP